MSETLTELKAALDKAQSDYAFYFGKSGQDSSGAMDLMYEISTLKKKIAALQNGGKRRKSKTLRRRRRGKTSKR
jgi:hypothetical protein